MNNKYFNKKGEMIIEKKWPELIHNPKYKRMLLRKTKTLKNLKGYKRTVSLLEKLIGGDRKNNKIMEIACGMGFHILEINSKGWNITGLEIDPNLVSLVNETANYFGLEPCAIIGDACNIPVADDSYDVVYSKSFFEHVYDVDLALREQIRILKPGGKLIIIDGNLLDFRCFVDLFFFYPLRTKGKYGGVKWLFNKNVVYENLYGYLKKGRDEDVKTVFWWKKRIKSIPELSLINVATLSKYCFPQIPKLFSLFLGSCVVTAKKIK